MFTYQHIREELKSKFLERPFSCTFSWIINWINLEISKLPPGSIVLELGTFVGGSTQLFARANKDIIVHTIDLNQFDDDNHMLRDIVSTYELPLLQVSDLLEIQKIHVEDFPNIILHTGDSKSLNIKNVSVVFIDANHTEEGVFADLEYAWNCLKDDGCIFGDDINCSQVYNAFAKFARDKDVELTLYSKAARIRKTNTISPNHRNFGQDITKDILVAIQNNIDTD